MSFGMLGGELLLNIPTPPFLYLQEILIYIFFSPDPSISSFPEVRFRKVFLNESTTSLFNLSLS